MRRRDARTAAFESGRAWRNVSKAFRNANPVCQVIEEGRRCIQRTKYAHHLIAPEDNWELRNDWHNLAGVCDHHHGPEAGDIGRYQYAPTKMMDGTWFQYITVARTKDNGPAMTGEPGKQFVSGGPSSEAVDAILAALKKP